MIKTFLTGRLTRDAEIKTHDNKKVMSYSVAVDIGTKDNPKTLFVECSQWSEKTAVAQYLLKGTQVAVEGAPNVRSYQKNDGKPGASFTLRVDRVELLGGKREADTGQAAAIPAAADITEPIDDLPF